MKKTPVWILSFATLLFSLSSLQAQEGRWAILLHPESGEPLCRIGERVNQDFLPESLLDETGQLQSLSECSDKQILAAAVETDWENVEMGTMLGLGVLAFGPLGGCALGLAATDDEQINPGLRLGLSALGGVGTFLGLLVLPIEFRKHTGLMRAVYLVGALGSGILCHYKKDEIKEAVF